MPLPAWPPSSWRRGYKWECSPDFPRSEGQTGWVLVPGTPGPPKGAETQHCVTGLCHQHVHLLVFTPEGTGGTRGPRRLLIQPLTQETLSWHQSSAYHLKSIPSKIHIKGKGLCTQGTWERFLVRSLKTLDLCVNAKQTYMDSIFEVTLPCPFGKAFLKASSLCPSWSGFAASAHPFP